MENEKKIDRSNEKYPVSKLIPLGLQHVLAMYAGAVSVPLIVGAAVGLDPKHIAMLVALDLFACGVATLIQALGIGNFAGIKLPAILGCSFAAVTPLITIGTSHDMRTAYGAILVAGLVVVLIAPLYGKILRFFPTVVTGTTLTMIGLSLIPVAVKNMGGGYVDDYGDPKYLGLAFFTILIVIVCNKFLKGFAQALSVLIALVIGTIIAVPFGLVNMTEVYEAAWFRLPRLFYLGAPKFEVTSIGLMTIVMLVVMVESTGSFIGLGKIVGKDLNEKELVKGFRAEGLATVVGAVFNSFPYTTFSQNIGLVSMTKVFSRWVVVASGGILMLLGLCPKFAALATIIPAPVFGGATGIMFAMVAISGMQSLTTVDFSKMSNMLTVAVSLTFGIGITVYPDILSKLPSIINTIFSSSIATTAICAIILNALLNWGDESSLGDKDSVADATANSKHM